MLTARLGAVVLLSGVLAAACGQPAAHNPHVSRTSSVQATASQPSPPSPFPSVTATGAAQAQCLKFVPLDEKIQEFTSPADQATLPGVVEQLGGRWSDDLAAAAAASPVATAASQAMTEARALIDLAAGFEQFNLTSWREAEQELAKALQLCTGQ